MAQLVGEVLINSTKLVIAPKGHKRAKRGNLTVHNQLFRDCFVTEGYPLGRYASRNDS
jgi:hypothetical protein